MHHWWIVWQLTQESMRAREAEYERRRRWELVRLEAETERPPRPSRAWTLRMPRLAFTVTLDPRRRES